LSVIGNLAGRRALAAAVPLLGLSLFTATQARANGRMAAGHQIAVSPTDPSFFVMETTFGLLISRDAWSTLGWVCEGPVGYGDAGIEDPSIGVTSTAILAGMREGLTVSSDHGCTWTFALSEPVVDVVVRTDDPHSALALTSHFTGTSDAGQNLFDTRVMVTHDDGATWGQVGSPLDPSLRVETIDIASSDPNRIYVGGVGDAVSSDGGVVAVGIVLVSTDGGASYARSQIALNPATFENLGAAFVSAVDPTNPDRVYVRIGGAGNGAADRLLVSDDGAATFRTVYQATGNLLGFALTSDGATLFIGGPLDGVLSASTPRGDSGAAFSFAQRSKANVTCLSSTPGKLYACMGEPQNTYRQQLGVSTDEGTTFASAFLFGCIPGPLACPNSVLAQQCDPGFGLVQASVGTCETNVGGAACEAGDCAGDAGGRGSRDAGTAENLDAGGAADAGEAPASPRAGCGCGVGEAAGAGGMSALAALLLAVVRRRRT
jgi:MYXO-CTERM domain-containing protein